MSLTPQFMVLGGSYTFAVNPDNDTEFHSVLKKADFDTLGGNGTITQILGRRSGERTFKGIFYNDSDYRAVESIYNAMRTTSLTDWLGNTYTIIIIDLMPVGRINDIAHNFQTIQYQMTVRRTS